MKINEINKTHSKIIYYISFFAYMYTYTWITSNIDTVSALLLQAAKTLSLLLS